MKKETGIWLWLYLCFFSSIVKDKKKIKENIEKNACKSWQVMLLYYADACVAEIRASGNYRLAELRKEDFP